MLARMGCCLNAQKGLQTDARPAVGVAAAGVAGAEPAAQLGRALVPGCARHLPGEIRDNITSGSMDPGEIRHRFGRALVLGRDRHLPGVIRGSGIRSYIDKTI